MKKEWYFDRFCGRQFAALIEDGKLAEFAVEKESDDVVVGNIYKGRVTNVLNGLNAAFINCGIGKNCYLSMEESYTDYTKYDGTLSVTSVEPLNLKVGDTVLVQVTKLQRGNKGAKVTTHLSFVGKHLIYLPSTDFLGISRKITNEKEREKLLKFAEKMRKKKSEDGYIIRTQATQATPRQMKSEAAYLQKLYQQMLVTAETAAIGEVLYKDDDLPVRTMRDSFGDELVAMHVGDEELYQKLLALLRLRGDIPERKLIKYTGERSMLNEQGITPLVYDSASPTVALECGGYLVIEHTEAMTVVDVNTGSYEGKGSHEETVFAVNMEAAREIARQVRLRNVGGIIVVDFIDMTEEAHREAVNEELKEYLSHDKTKCKVLPMSELCLTQFTRKRVGNQMNEYLVKPCPACGGRGDIHDDIFVVMRIRSGILDCFADGYTTAIIDVNERIMHRILNDGLMTIEANNRWKDKRVYFVPHKTYKEENFSVRGVKDKILTLPDKAQILY